MTKHSHKPGENIAEETVTLLIVEERLSEDIRELIESSKSRFTLAANAALVILYWNVGTRINAEILRNERAEYGKGFTRSNLLYMIRSAEFYRDKQTVHALSGQLNWTLFRDIIHINEILLREAQQ